MIKIIYAAFVSLLITSSALFSQEPSPKVIDSAKKADIIRLLTAMGNLKVADMVINDSFNHLKRFLPNLDSLYWEDLRHLIDENELLEMNAEVYDLYFTHDEIRELLKFYESPIGMKFSNSISEISNEMFSNEDNWRAKINKILFDKLSKDGYIESGGGEESEESKEEKK